MKQHSAIVGTRAAVVALLICVLHASGCTAKPTPLAAPHDQLALERTTPPDQLCRTLARAAGSGDRSVAAKMFPYLDHEDAGVRFCAYQALLSLLGDESVRYRPHAPRAERIRMAQEWRESTGVGAVDAGESQ